MQLICSWDTFVLFLWCSEWILLWDWGPVKLETTLQCMALRSVRLLHHYPDQVLHLCLKFIISCIRSLSRWLPNAGPGTRKWVGTMNAWSRAGWVKSSPAWGGTKCPRSPSWHKISLGASPVATCTHASAETWTWSRATIRLGGSYMTSHAWCYGEGSSALTPLPLSHTVYEYTENSIYKSSVASCDTLTPWISDSECNLQGWTPELLKATDTAHWLPQPPDHVRGTGCL